MDLVDIGIGLLILSGVLAALFVAFAMTDRYCFATCSLVACMVAMLNAGIALAVWNTGKEQRRLSEESRTKQQEAPTFTKQGADDFALGLAYDHCPYSDWRADDWKSGWREAKRNAARAKVGVVK